MISFVYKLVFRPQTAPNNPLNLTLLWEGTNKNFNGPWNHAVFAIKTETSHKQPKKKMLI